MALALVLIVAACVGTSAPSAHSSTSPSAPSTPSPSPKSSTAPKVVGFSCRLPVSSITTDGPAGGFIAFPAGTFEADPAARRTPAYFDRAVSAWLPVGRQAVSPDGSHYATTTQGVGDGTQTPATLHIVAASTGAERVIPMTALRPQPTTSGPFLEVLDFESDAVYGMERGQAGVGELYRVDLSTGAVTDLRGAVRPEAVESGGFWFGGPDPNATGLGWSPIDLERWDLRSRTTSIWFHRPSADVWFLGLDRRGAAVVLVYNHNSGGNALSTEIWLVTQPGNESRIYFAPTSDQTLALPIGMIADEHGLWFGSAKGVLFYSPDIGVRKVSDYAGYPANGCA